MNAQLNTLCFLKIDVGASVSLAVFDSVKAGFPSPAGDFMDAQIDLVKLLVPRPSSTFLMRVSGDSMTGVGIFDRCIIVVDRSVKARDGHICVCYMDGEFTVKRIRKENEKWTLYAENPKYPKIVPDEESNFFVWGTVTYALNEIVK